MKYSYSVKYNGKYYPPNTEIPTDEGTEPAKTKSKKAAEKNGNKKGRGAD